MDRKEKWLGKVDRIRQRGKIKKLLCNSLPRKIDCRGFWFLLINWKKVGMRMGGESSHYENVLNLSLSKSYFFMKRINSDKSAFVIQNEHWLNNIQSWWVNLGIYNSSIIFRLLLKYLEICWDLWSNFLSKCINGGKVLMGSLDIFIKYISWLLVFQISPQLGNWSHNSLNKQTSHLLQFWKSICSAISWFLKNQVIQWCHDLKLKTCLWENYIHWLSRTVGTVKLFPKSYICLIVSFLVNSLRQVKLQSNLNQQLHVKQKGKISFF